MSEPHLHRRAKEILADALQLRSEERAAYVAQVCGSDATLLAEVRSLLQFADDDSTLIDTAPGHVRDRLEVLLSPDTVTTDASQRDSSAAARYSAEAPVRVGKYRIDQTVGEGGMGRVFEAVQENPRRRVALKLIRAAQSSPGLLRRFEYEAQTLGRLEHPGIARIYEAGSAEVVLSETPQIVAGPPQPFIAMEFIEGAPLDAYAQRAALSIPDRLRLIVRVCQAVNYAHTKGVIHRDLKPSNIFVTADGTPKVLDFGIARVAEDSDASHTRTQEGQPVGTPAYMSPEQAAGSTDIDTRTDVYALGVILYELLTGTKPFDPRSLKTASFAELQRLIREVDPPKPSTLISSESSLARLATGGRSMDWRRIRSMIQGELDWIVLKCLEKDRTRRYESASALADDIGRYLDGDAVVAAPPSRAYLLRKFLYRHKGAVIAASAAGAALLIGAVGFAWQAQVARSERDRAVKAEAQTKARADELQKLSDFQSQMLAEVDATAAGLRLGADIRARLGEALKKAGVPEEERAARLASFTEAWSRVNATDVALELIKTTILQPALAAIDQQFADQPKLNADLRSAISSRYIDLGLLDDARAVTEEVLRIRRAAQGEDHPDTIGALLSRCKDLCLMGRPAEAEAILRPLIEREKPRLGPDDPLALMTLYCLGEALLAQNKLSEAETLLRTVLAGRRRVLGDDHRETLGTIGNLAMVLRGQARFAEAETFAREVLERRQRMYGDDHPDTLAAYNNLATIQLDAGRLAEAVEGFRKATEGWRRVQGEAHRNTLIASNNLAAALGRLDQHTEAEAIQRDLLERTRRILGPDHPDSLSVLSNLVTTLINLNKFDEVEPLCLESLERRVRMFGENSAEAATAYNVASFLRTRQRRYAEAEPFLRKAMEASQTVWGEDHPERLVLLLNMGILLRDLGRPAESEQCLRDVLERYKRVLGPVHPQVRATVGALSVTFFVEKKFAEIAQLLSAAEPDFRAAAAKNDNGELRGLLLLLGKARTAVGEFPAAEAALQEAHTLFTAARGPTNKKTLECVQDLISLYVAWHAAEPDKGYDAKAAAWRTKLEEWRASTQPASQPAKP